MYNYKDYKNERIYFYKPQFFFKNYKKINVKYKKNNKVIIQTPKMKIPFNLTDKKLCISFNKNDYFYNFIKYFDETIKKLIQLKKKSWFYNKLEYKPILSNYKDTDYMTINLPYKNEQYLFNVFDENLSKINVDSLNKNDEIILIIQLEYLWLNNNKIGCHWNVLQIKKYNTLDFNKCLIVDTPPPPPPPPPPINNVNEKYLKMLKMGIPVLAVKNNMIRDGKDINIINSLPDMKEDFIKSLNNPIKSKENKKLIPSTSDLLNMKNVLKKAGPNIKKKKKSDKFVISLDDIKNMKNVLKKPQPIIKTKVQDNDGIFAPSLGDITNMRNSLKKIDRNIPKKIFNTRFGLAPTVDELLCVINKFKKK